MENPAMMLASLAKPKREKQGEQRDKRRRTSRKKL
jgi:hypothetical protein